MQQHYTRIKILFFIALLVAFCQRVEAQILYAHAQNNSAAPNSLIAIDLNDCSYCPILTPSAPFDQVFLPDQRFLAAGNLYDTQMNLLGSVGIPLNTYSYANLNGLIYMVNGNSFYGDLYVMNPIDLQVVYVGSLPVGFPLYGGQLFVYNNELYAISPNGPFQIWKINTSTPASSTLWGTLPSTANGINPTTIRGTAYANNLVYIVDAFTLASTKLFRYNPATNQLVILCETMGSTSVTQGPFFNVEPGYTTNFSLLSGLTVSPPGITLPCICGTNSGNMANINPLKICAPESAAFPPASGVSLQPDDILQYILCTNPSAPLQTTVAVSNTPVFNYNPNIMTLGTNYYIFSIAGNNVNGSANPQDPCFDVSPNSITVTWGAAPQVVFSAPSTQICQGTCIDLNVTLTGTPPFSLTYNTGGANQVRLFGSNTGILTICAPDNGPNGSINVQSIRLEDQVCVCD